MKSVLGAGGSSSRGLIWLVWQYKEGPIYGTDITRSLLKAGFKGLVFICSANDECSSVKQYLDAGATGSLKKYCMLDDRCDELVTDIIQQCSIGFKLSTQQGQLETKRTLFPGVQDSPVKTVTGADTDGSSMNLFTCTVDARSDDGSVLVDELHSSGGGISS